MREGGSLPVIEGTPKPISVTSSALPPPPALSRPPSATKWQSQILWRQDAESAGLCVLRTQGGKVTPLTSFHQLVALAHPMALCGLCQGGREGSGRGRGGDSRALVGRVLSPPRFYPTHRLWGSRTAGSWGSLLSLGVSYDPPNSLSTKPVGSLCLFPKSPPHSGPCCGT